MANLTYASKHPGERQPQPDSVRRLGPEIARVLTGALAAGGDEAKRAFDAMMGMKKIDVAAIEAARRG